MSYNKEFFDVQSYVEFTKSQTLQELTSTENIAVSLGKIARYYNNLVRSDLDIKVNGTLKNYYRPLNTSDNQIDFRAGTNISLTYDDTNNSITINSAAGGSSVSYTPIITSGTAIGTLTIDGVSNTLYYTQYTHDTVTPLTAYGPSYVTYNSTGHITGSSYNIHSARGTNGSAGWVKVANIVITGTYANEPIKLTISQRGTGLIYDLNIKFSNAETDPTLARFLSFSDMADADNGNDAYIIKTDTNTWDLYIKKLDTYDLISVNEFDIGQHALNRLTWTWTDVHASTLPEGGTYVTKKTYLTEETVGYKAITQHSEIDGSTGSFVFSGVSAIFNDSGADYVGLQVGYSADEFQIIGSGNSDDNNSLFIRRNDTPNDSTKWTNWSRLLTAGAIGGSTAITVTPTTVTKGDYTISNGVTIAHSDVTSTSSTASKTLDYGESFNAISAVTVNAQGHVTAKTTTTYTLPASERKVAAIGSDTAGSEGWYKVADGTLTGYSNNILKFSVQCSYTGASGILYLDIRSNNSVLIVKKFGWLVHDVYNTAHFIINIDGTSWTIYQNITRTQYYRDFWTVIAESGTNSKTGSFTLYDSRTPESSSPVTSSSVYSDDYNDIFPYTETNPSSATSYGITFHTGVDGSTSDPSTRKLLRTNDGFKYYTREGTTSTTGYGYIVLGNNIPTGTAGNKCGAVRCYTTGDSYVQLSGAKDASSMRFSHSSGTAGNFSPSTDNIYDLGTSTERWKNIYASGTISGATGTFSSALTVNGTASVNGINLYNPTTQMYINLLAPSNMNSAYDITFPKKSGTVALTSDITGLNGGDTYTPIYMNNGVPTAISSLNDDGGWLVYTGGSTGADARLVTNRTIGHWNGRVGSAAGASNLCYFGCSDLDAGFAGDLLSVGGAIFSTNAYFSNSTQKFTGIQIGDTRNGYRKMQLVTAGGSSGRIYARYSTADNPDASKWSNPVSLLQTGDIVKGVGINITPSQVTFGDVTITKGYTIDLDFKVTTSGSGNVVTGISFLDDTLTVTKGTSPTGSAGSSTQPVYVSSNGTVTAVTQPSSGAWASSVPYINSSSEMKIGRYLDFHNGTSTNAYDVRLNNSSTDYLTMSSASGTPNLIMYGSETHIRFSSSSYSSNYNGITAYAADSNGLNMTLQSGGNLIIGSGEYPTNFYGATKTNYDYWDGTSGEKTYIGSDGHIIFHTNGGTIANRKTFMFSSNGHLYMPPSGNISFWFGTSQVTTSYHTLKPTTGTTARTWTLPDKTGTIALTSDISASRQYATGVNIGSVTIDGTATSYIVPKGTSSQTGAVTVSDSYSTSDGSASSSVAASSYAVNQVYQIASGKSSVSVSRNLTSGTKIGTITIDGSGTDLYCQTNTHTTHSLTINDASFTVGTSAVTKRIHADHIIAIRNTTNPTYWRKVADFATTGSNTTYTASFFMRTTNPISNNIDVGIFVTNCRVNSAGTPGTVKLGCLVKSSSLTLSNYVVNSYSNMTYDRVSKSGSTLFEIWVKGTGNYASNLVTIIDEARQKEGHVEDWKLYDSSDGSGLSTLPSATSSKEAVMLT